METRLEPLRLASPVIGAAGVFGLAADLDRLLRPVTWNAGQDHALRPGGDRVDSPSSTALPNAQPGAPPGAIVTASLAHRSRSGSPARLVEMAGGALLVPSGARTGVGTALRRSARQWAAAPCPVVVSLWDDTPDAVAAAAASLEGERGAAAIELRIDDPETLGATVRGVRRVCALPVWVKLAPDAPDLEAALHAAAAAGAVAATIGGGLQARAAGYAGVLVGPATFPVVLDVVHAVAATAALPIIAGGGVATVEDARAYLAAGAIAVQVGSAHFADPLAVIRIAAALES